MDEKPRTLLLALGDYNMVPSIFQFIDVEEGEAPYEQAVECGFESRYVLLSIGQMISCFMILVAVHFLLVVLSWTKIPCLAPLCKKASRLFVYGAYLRFWVEAYLELALAVILQAQSVRFTQFSRDSDFGLTNIMIWALLAVVSM